MPRNRSLSNADPAPVPQVVGIGASAGGLEALEAFFEKVAPDAGLAFVVVQHLSPDYKSMMVELLSRRTAMKIVRVEDGMTVEANCIYLITPKKNMVIYHGKLLLTEQDRGHINLPIDIFFRSLAEDQGARAVGIILSGTGSDGMRGVRAIKEAGGMVMAQAVETAKFDGMPRSAISTGLVDFILPPGEMPERLLHYVRFPHEKSGEQATSSLGGDEGGMAKVLGLLQKQVGIDFSLYKPNTVQRRIERRMSINQIWRLDDYVRYLEKSPREINTLFKELLIGVTTFFRDGEAFRLLQEKIVPELVESLPADGSLRIWSAGCSTGEEPYSLAILFQEQLEKSGRLADIKVFATDLDRDAIDFAAAGIYPESCAADVSPERLARFFVRRGENYHISRKIREMVVFAHHNLLKDPPFTRIDLLACRNMLIYLQPPVQKKLLGIFDFSLRPGGCLFLGSSETVGDLSGRFKTVDGKWKLYRSPGGPRRLLPEMLVTPPGRERLRLTRANLNSGSRLLEDDRFMEPLYQAIIQDYVPPGVLIDEHHDILHVFSPVDDYLRFPVGRLSANALKAVHRDLAAPLGTALLKAGKSLQEVVYRGIEFGAGGRHVDLLVRPFEDRRNQRNLFLVFFREPVQQPVEKAPGLDRALDISGAERLADLERELQLTKENLQATIEELETSNEELQATNEELVSSNEELQSTNEELQSVNEELYTVNAEYQNKIQELVELNDDMDNLLHSMNLGTLFLDERVHIRRFTAPVSAILSVQNSDVGRPLQHLSHRLPKARLVEDAQAVLDAGRTLERELETDDGRWVLMTVSPYRKEGKPTRTGVVMTFVDITSLKEAQLVLQRERDLLARIMETTSSGVLVTDASGRVMRANLQAGAIHGSRGEDLEGRSLQGLLAGASALEGDALEGERHPAVLAAGGREFHDSRYALPRDGGLVFLAHNGKPLLDADGRMEGFIHVFRDIGEEIRVCDQLKKRRRAGKGETTAAAGRTAAST